MTPAPLPLAYLRDIDGTGSLHVCSKGDPGAIAVYGDPIPTVNAYIEELQSAAYYCDDSRDTTLRLGQDSQGDVWISIASNKPEIFKTVRLRTFQGGGARENFELRHTLAKFLQALKSKTVGGIDG